MSTASLADKLIHAKRETKALKAQLEASRIAYDDLLAAFDKSVYKPEVIARRNMFKRARDKYNER
jgi:hypothetical protein